MRTAIVLLLVGVCTLAASVPVTKPFVKVADKEYLTKQKDILRLFNYVNQPSYYKDFVEIEKTFAFEGKWDQWTKPEYAKQFWYYYQHDILPQGEVFSIFYPEHLKQAVALFKTFKYAKDYDTFYQTAVWARQNVNEGMFVYALSVAVLHSEWTQKIVLPPIHEIYPHYFFNTEVITTAQQYKQHYWGTYDKKDEIKDETYKGYTIHANYSGWYLNVHPEQSMTYFTEDVGMNAHYWYNHLYMPFWMTTEDSRFDTSIRGEYFYFYHQQLLARYYLERLSNGFGEIPHYEYEYPIETGYYPSLTYPNGLHFPVRPNHAELYYHGVHGKQDYDFYGNYSYTYTYVKDYERRLRDALDRGFVYTQEGKIVSLYDEEGFETLGKLVSSTPESPNKRYYGDLQVFARHLLGYSTYPIHQYKVVPSALEHFETSLRDPMFWQMYKRIMFYFFQHQQYQGPYEQEELYFDGVKVEEIQVDRLITYFDYFYSDLSNGVYVNQEEFENNSFEIRARQYRLNHKPFNYKINVVSEKPVDAFVKVFIGPKYDEYGRVIDIEDNRKNFFEIDRFPWTLAAGKNVIERNSLESKYYSKDPVTYNQWYKQIVSAINGETEYKYYSPIEYYGIPQRFMLPKGDFGGKTYQFYIIVAPYHEQKVADLHSYYHIDLEYSMGYPLDRPIEFEHEFFVPNSYFKDVVVYHKNTEEEINTTWSKY